MSKRRCCIEQVTFRDYTTNPAEYTIAFGNYWKLHGSEITAEMERHGYVWVVICGGQIISGSRRMDEFPSEEQIAELGRRHNRIPLAYSKAFAPEEVLA